MKHEGVNNDMNSSSHAKFAGMLHVEMSRIRQLHEHTALMTSHSKG